MSESSTVLSSARAEALGGSNFRGRTTIEKLLLKPEEAADLLGIGRSKLYELLLVGAIESVRIGSCRRVPLVALQEFVARLRERHPDQVRPNILSTD